MVSCSIVKTPTLIYCSLRCYHISCSWPLMLSWKITLRWIIWNEILVESISALNNSVVVFEVNLTDNSCRTRTTYAISTKTKACFAISTVKSTRTASEVTIPVITSALSLIISLSISSEPLLPPLKFQLLPLFLFQLP